MLRGYLTGEGKLLVENTSEANLVGFMPGGRALWVSTNPENALIVAGPQAFAGERLYEGRYNENVDASTYPSFIFARKG